MIIPYGNGYLEHNHTGPTIIYAGRTVYVDCMACILIDTALPWPLQWDDESLKRYQEQEKQS